MNLNPTAIAAIEVAAATILLGFAGWSLLKKQAPIAIAVKDNYQYGLLLIGLILLLDATTSGQLRTLLTSDDWLDSKHVLEVLAGIVAITLLWLSLPAIAARVKKANWGRTDVDLLIQRQQNDGTTNAKIIDSLRARTVSVAQQAEDTACSSRNIYWALKILQLVLAFLITAGFSIHHSWPLDELTPLTATQSGTNATSQLATRTATQAAVSEAASPAAAPPATPPDSKPATLQKPYKRKLNIPFSDEVYEWAFAAKSAAILAALIVLVEALQQAGQFHQHWIVFKLCKERIISEWQLFVTGVEPYESTDSKQKFARKIEDIICDTNIAWTRTETQEPASKPILGNFKTALTPNEAAREIPEAVSAQLSITAGDRQKLAFSVEILENEKKRTRLNELIAAAGLLKSPTNFSFETYDQLVSTPTEMANLLHRGVINLLKNQIAVKSDPKQTKETIEALSDLQWVTILERCKAFLSDYDYKQYIAIFNMIDALQHAERGSEKLSAEAFLKLKDALKQIAYSYFIFLLDANSSNGWKEEVQKA